MSTNSFHKAIDSLDPSSFCRRFIEFLEVAVVLTFFILFWIPAARAIWLDHDLVAALLAAGESFVVILLLTRRRANQFSLSPVDWVLAFGATLAPLLLRPGVPVSPQLTQAAVVLMIGGIGFQIYAKYTLGRRFGIIAANRGICAEGPYNLVRHPIYLGYLMTHVGFLCGSFSAWNLFVVVTVYGLMVPRIFAEERLLRRDDRYEAYCGKVRSRLIPGVL